MIKRVVEISNPARLSLKNRQMLVEQGNLKIVAVPIEDIGVLILDNPQIVYTQGLLVFCSENNVAVVICDKRHLPSAMLLPFEGNNLHAKTIAQQIRVAEPVRKRLWKEIIKAKIKGQSKVLYYITGNNPFSSYLSKVRSGDPDNIEAQVSRLYWRELFGRDFKRDYDMQGINSFLNYGYAIMRAAVARAIVSTGLHPSLGLHHHNQYNSFCMADDLIEPLRPVVDLKVYKFFVNSDHKTELTTDYKRVILELLSSNFIISGTKFPLMVALHRYAASVRKIICKEDVKLEIPEL